MNNQLSEQPLAELLREISQCAMSGTLRLARNRVQAVIYAREGAVIYARTNLRAQRVRQATDVLRPLLLWTDGTWSFDPRARLAEETAGSVPLAELLIEAARRLPADFVAARLRDEDSFAPAAEPPAASA